MIALAAHDRASPTQRNPPLEVGLLKDLISDDPRQHMAGMFQAEAGRGIASVRSTRDAIRDTVASYAISDERPARKKVLDNWQ